MIETETLKLSALEQNTGQIDGLPSNPREWTKDDVDRLARSIQETPELLEARPLIVARHGGKHIVLGGNLRLAALRQLKRKDAPCAIVPDDTPLDKLKEIVVKDNGSFGRWDYDALANEWGDLPLPDWGVPVWDPEADVADLNLSTQGREGGEGYDAFVEKFNEDLPLTTDDCYTPPEVYDIIRDYVDEKVTPLKGRTIVRPFFPGGDYEDLKQYPDGCIVLDNPPFSLYSKIVRFYLERGIDFFLFGPQLSLLVQNADCCFCPFNVVITYENGAKVNTGFVTNLKPGLRIWIDHTLRDLVTAAQKAEPTTPVYNYPAHVVSSATLGKIANCGELEIFSDECEFVHNLDGMKEIDRGLFGGGILLSTAAAEKARAAAEKARAAAERARAVNIELSAREKAIVARLDAQAVHTSTDTAEAQQTQN